MTDHASDRLIRQAIEALAAAARRRIEKHPMGHLLGGRRSRLDLPLPVPLGPADGALDDAVRQAEEALDAELEAWLAESAAFRPGRIYCLRCASAECEHSAPRDAREVFAGYGASGRPRFADFAQWLLERGHPHLDRVYASPPRLVTEVVSGRELTGELLPAFRDAGVDLRVHGQVTAGWFMVGHGAERTGLALSFQVLSTAERSRRRRQPRRRLILNVLGRGPGGEPLEELHAGLGAIPWQPVVGWGQRVLETIEGAQGRKGSTPEVLSRRVEGMLQEIARRLEQGRRARERRTGHAEERHHQGDRPTRMALTDLERGDDESFFVDERRSTVIVLGERGRAHVFNFEGKLVTSIRTTPESVERKLRRELWRRATPGEIARLREKASPGG